MGSFLTFDAPCPECNNNLSFQDKILLEAVGYETCYWPTYSVGDKLYENVKDFNLPLAYGNMCRCPGIVIARIRDNTFEGFEHRMISGGEAAILCHTQGLIARCRIPWNAQAFEDMYLEGHEFDSACREWLRPKRHWRSRQWKCKTPHDQQLVAFPDIDDEEMSKAGQFMIDDFAELYFSLSDEERAEYASQAIDFDEPSSNPSDS